VAVATNIHPNVVLASTLCMLAWPDVITEEHHIRRRFGNSIQTAAAKAPAVPLDINFTRTASFSSQKFTVMIFHL
jgi:hypothetical protein